MYSKLLDGPANSIVLSVIFFFNDTATTEIYTLSLHDALPIYGDMAVLTPEGVQLMDFDGHTIKRQVQHVLWDPIMALDRSEEHTSELQSQSNLVCRLLLEKKNGSGRGHSTLQSTPGKSDCCAS